MANRARSTTKLAPSRLEKHQKASGAVRISRRLDLLEDVYAMLGVMMWRSARACHIALGFQLLLFFRRGKPFLVHDHSNALKRMRFWQFKL